MARCDSPGFDVAALNGRGGNLIAGNGCGKDLVRGDCRCGNLLRCDRPGNNNCAVDLLLVFLILQFLYGKAGRFSVNLIDYAVRSSDDQALCGQRDRKSVV